MRYFLVLCVAVWPLLLKAQEVINPHDTLGYHYATVVIDGDSIPVIYLNEYFVSGNRPYANTTEIRQWNRLMYNVRIAYPYARLAGIKFDEYSKAAANIKDERKKKEMMRKVEDELQAQFGDELKELTITQGKILLKLIDRQTKNSSYDIVRDFRGGFRAFFYQNFARLFGYNLKVKYDPLGEDAEIERIVLMIENGTI